MSPSTNTEVRHIPWECRYEFGRAEALAVIDYELQGGQMTITHTFVPEEYRGQGIAEKLVRAALADARTKKYDVVPQCSYVAKFIARHAEFQDLLGV
jgi:predicted GNAT family acetyltransferase